MQKLIAFITQSMGQLLLSLGHGMSKSRGQSQAVSNIAKYGPLLVLSAAVLLYGGLIELVLDKIGPYSGGCAVIVYAILGILLCIWSATRSSGAVRVVAVLSIPLLLLFGLWGYVIVWFSGYQF